MKPEKNIYDDFFILTTLGSGLAKISRDARSEKIWSVIDERNLCNVSVKPEKKNYDDF